MNRDGRRFVNTTHRIYALHWRAVLVHSRHQGRHAANDVRPRPARNHDGNETATAQRKHNARRRRSTARHPHGERFNHGYTGRIHRDRVCHRKQPQGAAYTQAALICGCKPAPGTANPQAMQRRPARECPAHRQAVCPVVLIQSPKHCARAKMQLSRNSSTLRHH